MPEFDAHRVLDGANERHEHLSHGGDPLVPISAATIAVLAALATLFANHGSTAALAQKNETIIYQSKAFDQYNYYESKRIKVHLNQALLDAGIVRDPSAQRRLESVVDKEASAAKRILVKARAYDAQAKVEAGASERQMASYESYEIAATFFEVAVVLASVTLLMRTRALLYVAGAGTAAGLWFFISGFLH